MELTRNVADAALDPNAGTHCGSFGRNSDEAPHGFVETHALQLWGAQTVEATPRFIQTFSGQVCCAEHVSEGSLMVADEVCEIGGLQLGDDSGKSLRERVVKIAGDSFSLLQHSNAPGFFQHVRKMKPRPRSSIAFGRRRGHETQPGFGWSSGVHCESGKRVRDHGCM